MKIITKNNRPVAVIDASKRIANAQEILDLMATAQYMGSSGSMVVFKESLGEDFFDLKTRFAGEVLQKFSNYRVQLAIVGDFNMYTSKALRDFIYECNKGNLVFFKNSLDEALNALVP
jgi:GTPase SAR1 family protein